MEDTDFDTDFKEFKKKKLSANEKKAYDRSNNEKYFEGTVQLRNVNEEQMETIVAFIQDNGVNISKTFVHGKNSIDLFLSSQKFIQQFSKWIKARYNCNITLSSTLHTRDNQTSKDLYRLTLLVNFMKLKIGDIIEYHDEKVKITSLGKKPSARVISNGQRIFIDQNFLDRL